MTAYTRAETMFPGTFKQFLEWWCATLEPLLPEPPARGRRRAIGDHCLGNPLFCSHLRQFDDDHWCYEYADEDIKVDSNTESLNTTVCTTVLEEIYHYFDNNFSSNA